MKSALVRPIAALQEHAATRVACVSGLMTGSDAAEREENATLWAKSYRAGASADQLVEQAFDYWHQRVYRLAHRILGEATDAEEVTQEVFETLLRTLGSLQQPESLPGYLARCSVHASRRRLRTGRFRRVRSALLSATETEAVKDHDLALSVRQILESLQKQERIAVVLRHVENHTLEETAGLMSVSVSTVQRLLLSARKKLQSLDGGGVPQFELGQWEGS